MKGVRAVRGQFVADEHGMPVLRVNHDDLVRASWELVMERFFPEPKPPTRWQQFKMWLLKPSEKKK